MEKVGAYTDRATESGEWRPGAPGAGQSATPMLAAYFNMLQRELLGVVEAADIEPNAGDDTQLLQALNELIERQVPDKLVVPISANTALTAAQLGLVLIDASGDNRAITLPAANEALGVVDVILRRIDASATSCVVAASGVDKLMYNQASVPAGYGLLTLDYAGHWVHLRSDGAGKWWHVGGPVSGNLPTSLIQGLAVANNIATPATDVDFAPGRARDNADSFDLVLRASLTKRLQSAGAWAAGAGANGLFSGTRRANTWYHLFLIRKDADGSIDAGFDTNFNAANRPAGYGAFRRLGSVKTDGSGNILGFINFGDTFMWKAPIRDAYVAGVAANPSATITLSVPPGLRVMAKVHVGAGSNGVAFYARPPDADVVTIPAVNIPAATWTGGVGVNTNDTSEYATMELHVLTNTAAQIALQFCTGSTTNYGLVTVGWREAR